MVAETRSNASGWMFFVGMLLLLMGTYGFLRMYHIQMRKVPYPSHGILPSNLLTTNMNFTYGRESDCEAYPMLYYEADGKTVRQPSEEEKAVAEQNTARCINGFNEDRAKQRQDDKNLSAFLVFVGLGLIATRRFLRD